MGPSRPRRRRGLDESTGDDVPGQDARRILDWTRSPIRVTIPRVAHRRKLTVSLTPGLASFVEDRVRSGRYRTATEVVREALRLLRERERLAGWDLTSFRDGIKVALVQLRRGEGVDGESYFRRVAA